MTAGPIDDVARRTSSRAATPAGLTRRAILGLALLAALPALAAEPCSLLTTAEVATVIGVPVGEAKRAAMPQPTCEYSARGGTVYVYRIADGRAGFQAGRQMQDAKAQAVAGVGDDAYWSPGIRTLNVLSRDTYLMVQFIGIKGAGLDMARALASRAVGRL